MLLDLLVQKDFKQGILMIILAGHGLTACSESKNYWKNLENTLKGALPKGALKDAFGALRTVCCTTGRGGGGGGGGLS